VPKFAAGDRLTKDIVLVRPLIQGGMGTVWVARHEGLRSEVAVKLLAANFADDEVAKARFAREAGAAMEVQSPHVVQMLDYGVSDAGSPYLVMELLSGDDLEAKLTQGPLPPRDVVSIVTQLGSALNRAHERSILHRDVKPANVFLMPSDGFSGDKYFVKLLDFGFAKRIDRLTAQLTEEGMVVGTPQYMSPEQMSGEKLDPRSDLFALASVAFEAFTGKRAFQGNSVREIAEAITGRSVPRATQFNGALPRDLDAWFAKAFARDREQRFASAREMVAALQQIFASSESDEPVPEARVVPPAVIGRPSRFWQISVTLALVLAAAALAVYIFRG
jgi:serine/threonine protein kinase